MPDLVGIALALGWPAQRLGPLRLVGMRPLAQVAVLAAAAGQHRHEAAAVAIDVTHLLARAQLAVGDVEEVRAPSQLVQPVPRGDVRLVVVGVAIGEAVRERDRAVSADGQDPQQLLEIGAVLLVVAVSGRRRRLAGTPMAVGRAIGAGECDRGRVVVQLGAIDVELADHAEHQLGQQRRAVGVKQPVQRAADAIVIEQRKVIDR